jgi:hypothetical protein
MDSTVSMDSAADTGHMEDSPADTSPPMDSSVEAMAEAGQDAPVDSPADTSTSPETDTDASDGAGPLVPCTTAGQTNCVKCDGQTTGLCTPTEAIVVQYDIDKGLVTAPGPEPMTACYECLTGIACLDDSIGDTGHECEDTLAVGTADQCRATLSCALSSNCAAVAVSTCYCGTAGVATTCHGNPAPGPINGACATQIATGLGFPVTDGTDNANHLTDPTRAAGKAVEIMYCGQNNGCTQCFM